MKRKFAILAVLGALVALAVPASSMGAMYPAGHKFQLAGTSPKLGTSLGSCTITGISGTIPAAPANETATSIPISTPTVGSCTPGTSVTLGGEWKLLTTNAAYHMVVLGSGTATLTMRFSSLPGCQLTQSTSAVALSGIWSNGATAPKLMPSGYHAHMALALVWKDDGGTCALAGKTETLAWTSETGNSSTTIPTSMTVTDVTNSSMPVIIGATP